jgi:hypothetical protein
VVVALFVTGPVATFVTGSSVVSPIASALIGSSDSVAFRGASYRMVLLFNPDLEVPASIETTRSILLK